MLPYKRIGKIMMSLFASPNVVSNKCDGKINACKKQKKEEEEIR